MKKCPGLTCAEIFTLPRDLVLNVLFYWLSISELALLVDSSLSNHELRETYLTLLQGMVVPASTHTDHHLGLSYLKWINQRQLRLHSLYLEKVHVSVSMSSVVADVLLAGRTTLTELSLSHIKGIHNDHFKQLIDACSQTLTFVEIDNCYHIDGKCLDHLFRTVKHLNRVSLIGFDMGCFDFEDTTGSSLKELSKNPSVRSLKVVTLISATGMKVLLQACPGLERLDYELDDHLPHEKTWIESLSASCPQFHTLCLNGYKSTDHELLAHVARELPQIQSLIIEEGVIDGTIIDAEFFQISLPENHSHHPQRINDQYKVLRLMKGLKELAWQGPCVQPRQMLSLVSSFSTLKKVDFGYNQGITDEVIVKLCRMNRHLEELILPSSLEVNHCLTDEAIYAIVKYCPQLRSLTIPFGEHLTDESVVALGNALALEVLYLDHIPAITEEAIMELGINSEGRLKKLTINGMELSDDVRRILCSLSIQVTYKPPPPSPTPSTYHSRLVHISALSHPYSTSFIPYAERAEVMAIQRFEDGVAASSSSSSNSSLLSTMNSTKSPSYLLSNTSEVWETVRNEHGWSQNNNPFLPSSISNLYASIAAYYSRFQL